MTRIELDPVQEEAVQRMAVEPTRAALLAPETGVGKTVMCVELAKRINAKTILVIAPKGTAGSIRSKKGWEYTFHRQGVDLPFRRIDADNTDNFYRLKDNEPGIYFIGREFFGLSGTNGKPKKVKGKIVKPARKQRWKWSQVNPDLAIFDEVQTASNRDSVTYEALRTLKAGYKVASSATPNGNKFTGMWSITRWLWGNTRNPEVPYDPDAPYKGMYVDNSFWRWAATWAVVEEDPYADWGQGRKGKKVTRERVPGAFVASLPCYIRIEAERVPYDRRNVYVDLTPTQRRIYDEMEAQALAWLDEHPLVAEYPLTKRIRLRQITLAEPTVTYTGEYDEDGRPEFEVGFEDDAESAKLDALEKIIEGYSAPDETMLILTDSQKFARLTAKRLGPTAREWSGAVSQSEREQIKAEFGKSVRFIVAVIPAIAEGVDGLQDVCHTEVWLSESLNDMLNQQVEGRLNRRGQKAEKIIKWRIMARNTDDDGTFQRLMETRRQNRASLGGRKR